MARIPNKVDVGPFGYKIVQNLPEDKECFGMCDHRELKISLLPGLAKDAKAETLFHEILHACFFASSLHLPQKEEERIVAALSVSLLHVLRTNPTVTNYLIYP